MARARVRRDHRGCTQPRMKLDLSFARPMLGRRMKTAGIWTGRLSALASGDSAVAGSVCDDGSTRRRRFLVVDDAIDVPGATAERPFREGSERERSAGIVEYY